MAKQVFRQRLHDAINPSFGTVIPGIWDFLCIVFIWIICPFIYVILSFQSDIIIKFVFNFIVFDVSPGELYIVL
jgi:hypothetical protein